MIVVEDGYDLRDRGVDGVVVEDQPIVPEISAAAPDIDAVQGLGEVPDELLSLFSGVAGAKLVVVPRHEGLIAREAL